MYEPILKLVIGAVTAGIAATLFASAYKSFLASLKDIQKAAIDLAARRTKLEAEIEKKPQDQPSSPTLAWDLARVTLEQYFNRNLAQSRLMFFIALLVMMFGFGLVVWSTIYATLHTQSSTVSWVGAASGVITQFIGATFMVMYKSNTEQSSDYVRILERINAVGMAVQLLDGIPDADPLLSTTKSEMAKLLLEGSLYRRSPSGPPVRPRKDARGRAKRST
jgi:hypothetical protein